MNEGDQLEVEVTDVDRQGRVSLTPVAWLERQVAQGKTIEEAREAAQVGGGGGGGRGGDRGGRDRDRGDAVATVAAAAETAVAASRDEPLVRDDRLGPMS